MKKIQNKYKYGKIDWEDSFEIDDFVKNKNFESNLIKIANVSVSLESVFKKLKINFSIQYSPSGWTHKTVCPFPDHSDKTPSFGYNPNQNCFNCFGCHRGGQVVNFLSVFYDKEPIIVAKELLCEINNPDEIIYELKKSDKKETEKINELLFNYTEFLRNFLKINFNKNAEKYAESVTLSLDLYLRKNYMKGKINIEHLNARIIKLKHKLLNYGE